MHRLLKWSLVGLASLVGLLLVTYFALLRPLLAGSAHVVARVVAPQGDLAAVLVETNGGATTSFGYEVSVVPVASTEPGRPAARLYGAKRNDQAFGVNLRWVSPSQLQVEFKQAREAAIEHSPVEAAGRKVSVVLQAGVIDPLAPPGGMLYNLQGRP